MTQKPTLLVLAAGMGSRYGGLKQIDKLGPNGETIIDYSIFDAIQAGFGKVVFVIRKSIETDFKEVIFNKYKNHLEVDYVLQELNALPEGFFCPDGREKPWGTGHAILMAKEKIDNFFAVINGDDFYGRHAFETMAHFLQSLSLDRDSDVYSMVAYQLSHTLSENGSVSRGVCHGNANDFLVSIKEHTKIQRQADKIINTNEDGSQVELREETPVSMNFWGFHPSLFGHLERLFTEFLWARGHEMKSEFYIPFAVDDLIKEGKAKVKLLHTEAEWFGITYQADRPAVVKAFQNLLLAGVYPKQLW